MLCVRKLIEIKVYVIFHKGSIRITILLILFFEGGYNTTFKIFDPNDKNTTFIDNFNIYIDKTSFYLEIFLVYPLYSFSYFIKYLYEILVIFVLIMASTQEAYTQKSNNNYIH